MNPGTEWIDQARRVLDALRGGIADAASGDGASQDGHTADCRWCPICQVAAVVRGERPELTNALADVLTATATALRAFAAEGTPASSTAGEPDRAEPADGDPPPTVQRIEIA
jgi:hypothetical protein